MSAGNGATPATPPKLFRFDRQTGDVVLLDKSGRERRLRPTMAAAEQIEAQLGAGMNVLQTRIAAAAWPFAPQVVAEPKMVPSSSELAVILLAGLQAGGEKSATLDDAKKIVWDLGPTKTASALFEFAWAATDGGRLREDDLKNEVSPPGSLLEPSGDQTEEDQITADLLTEPSSESSSG